jgi:hypothetical protein
MKSIDQNTKLLGLGGWIYHRDSGLVQERLFRQNKYSDFLWEPC